MPGRRQKPRETVTRVIDGDTFETASRPAHSIRLQGVNTPEKGQPGYGAAKRKLNSLIAGKKVEVKSVARDKYGRTVAEVRVDGRSVNAAIRK